MLHQIKKNKNIIIVITIIFILLPFKKSYAQRFSWSGMIELSFRERIDRSRSGETETRTDNKTFAQRYFLNFYGPIVDPRFAVFTIGTTFTHTWDELNDMDSNTTDYGYNITTTLFPQRPFPLTLYTNRFESDSDSSIYQSRKSITTAYGLRWSVMFRSLPTIRLFMEQSEYESNDPQQRKNETKREASLELNKVTSQSVFFSRYRYENLLDKISNSTSDVHGVDMNYGSQLTRILHLRTFGSYDTTTTTGTKRDKDNIDSGIGLYFHPTVYLDLSTDYNFSYTDDESYSAGAFQRTISTRHLSSTSLYFHPDPRIDTRLGYYYGKTIAATDLDSHQATFSIIGRPITGLNLLGNGSYLYSESRSGILFSKTESENYGAGYAYTLPLKNLTFNTNYSFNYGQIDVEPGENGYNTNHTAGAGIAYNLNIVLISTDYQFNTREESRAGVEDREEHRARLGLVSYYISGLAATANFGYDNLWHKKEDMQGITNEIFTIDTKLDYNIWRGLFFSGGYSLYNYSDPASNDTETLFAEGRIVFFPIRNMFATAKIREEWYKYSLFPFGKDVLLGEARLDYMIRKLLLSAEYSYSLEKQGGTETTKEMMFFRVTRSF